MGLLDDVLGACGGADRWQATRDFTAHLSLDGALFAHNGAQGRLKDLVAEGSTRAPALRLTGFLDADRCGVYRPDRVSIERLDGDVLQMRRDPAAALARRADAAAWDELDLAYVCGLSIWSGLTMPFRLADPGVALEELPPWQERGEAWRRLRAVFPPAIAVPSTTQTVYVDRDGLPRRIDHDGVGAAAPIAELVWAHQRFSGLVVPTLRRALGRRGDGSVVAQPVLLDLEIFDARFT